MNRIIDKYTIISTKRGDKGQSRNYSNDLLPKTNVLFQALGSIDELSSMLGLAYHHSTYKKDIKLIQLDLQHINSMIATNPDDPNRLRITMITEEDVLKLEEIEQRILQKCQIEPKFILPGSDSTKEGAFLDMARSISRRVERVVLLYLEKTERDDLNDVTAYLNRLSDLLFIMARSKDEKK